MGSRKRELVKNYFEYYCEVTPPSSKAVEPAIVYQFPKTSVIDELVKTAVKFIFPFEFERNFVQHFSFVLTDIDAKFTYGYCRHDPRIDCATVFLSQLECHDAFYKHLDEIALMKRSYPTSAASRHRGYEGESFRLDHFLRNIQSTTVIDNILIHKLPRIPENRNLTDYFSAVDSQAMVGMLGALLHERRIIVRSKKPARLSACVQAANDLLYPLVWQHIFIPVLPESLVDYLSAPMPFLIGVSEEMFLKLTPIEIGEVVVLDADRNSFTSPFDDLASLSIDVQSALRRTIKSQELGADTVSRAFLKAIVQIIGGYESAIKLTDGNLIFDADIFLTGCKSSMRNFRTQLLMTQTFQQFIEDRLSRIVNGNTRSDEFEREYAIWDSTKNSRSSTSTGRISGSAIDLLRNVKEMTQPAVETAVESVRQGGRDVKQALRGMKSRIETTSYNTRSKLRLKKNIPSSTRLSGDIDALNLPCTSKMLSEPGKSSDLMTQSLDFSKIPVPRTPKSDFDSYIRGTEIKLTPLFGSPPAALSPLYVIPLVTPPPPEKPTRDLIELDLPSTSETTSSAWRTVKSSNKDVADLIQLDDEQSMPTRQQETDLLGEYGIDFEKFKISRDNWTTFE